MVASSCATFMIGPFSPPRAAARLAASRSRSRIKTEQPAGGDAGGDAADIGADAAIALGAGGEAIAFLVRGHGGSDGGHDPKGRGAAGNC